jgi:hypothetical protein
MKFVEVKEIPGDRRYTAKGELRDRFEEFMKMNVKIVKIENHGYATNRRAYNAFYKSNRNWAYPIDVIFRNDEVYLRRRDI